jgi:hypothetical protein
MKLTFGAYEHSRIGFPGVKLKWMVEDGKVTDAYLVIKGVISQPWTWHELRPMPFMEYEMSRFDTYVLTNFAEDSTVQG